MHGQATEPNKCKLIRHLWAIPSGPPPLNWTLGMGKCRCGPYVVALRIGNAVADGELRVLLLIGKAVADVQEGRCGFCRGGAALSGTLRMDLRNLQRDTCVLWGDVLSCVKIRRPAADLKPSGCVAG